jgi:putative DNA primase/helicase
VTASETEEGRRWDEAKLKHLSGRDTITARFSRGDFFDFAPTFKLLFAGNHRPRMRSADDAMRDRFHMIPFKHRADPPDKELIDKLQAELGGILKWAVRGEIERRRLGGLRPPKIVVEATDKYFEDEDTLGRWIGERCIVASAGENSTAAEIARRREAFTATADLYRDYKSWASRVGEFIPAQKVLTAKLERLAEAGGEFRYERTKAARGFRGLALKSNPGDLPLDSPAAERSREVGGLAERPELGEYLPGHDDPAEDWPRE